MYVWQWYMASGSFFLCDIILNCEPTSSHHGPLARYVKLGVAHAPGMPGTFSQPSWFGVPDMHHGTCVTHVPWWESGSLISGFLWSRWQGKSSWHSRLMRNSQFYVSGKRPMNMTPSLRVNMYAPRFYHFIQILLGPISKPPIFSM